MLIDGEGNILQNVEKIAAARIFREQGALSTHKLLDIAEN